MNILVFLNGGLHFLVAYNAPVGGALVLMIIRLTLVSLAKVIKE